MQDLSSHDITHLAKLARLEISEEESSTYAGQLSEVVAYVEALKDVPAPRQTPAYPDADEVLAPDTPRTPDDQRLIPPASILAGAPLTEDGYFVVKSVLTED